MRKSGIRSGTGRRFQQVPGSILSFVPAHGGSGIGVVAEELTRTLGEALGIAVMLADFNAREYTLPRSSEAPLRLDGRNWGTLVSEVEGLEVLDARDVQPEQLGDLLGYAREYYSIICADLSRASESQALEVLEASDGIFLVADSDPASLQGVSRRIEWLRSIDLAGRCGLLLKRDPKGYSPGEVEDLTGVPVCSLIDTEEQLSQLAGWLASAGKAGSKGQLFEFALAV